MKMTGSPEFGNLEVTPQFNSRHATKMDVQEKTINLSCGTAIEECLGRCKDLCCKSMRAQEVLGGPEHTWIVIHDRHDHSLLQHGYPSLLRHIRANLVGRPSAPMTFMTEATPDETCL